MDRAGLWLSVAVTAAAFATWMVSGEWSLLAGDASLFYYIGQQIAGGVAPYREIWDHKPPLLFDLTALGVQMTPGRAWGVWAVALAMQAWGWACFFGALRGLCGAWAALAGQAAVGLLLWMGMEWAAGAVSAKLYHHYTATMLIPAAGLIALLAVSWPKREQAGAAIVWTLAGIAAFTLVLEAGRGVRYRFAELASEELLQAAKAESGPVLPLTWGLMPRDLWFRVNKPPATAIFHTTSFHGEQLYRRLAEPMLSGFLQNTPPLAIVRQGHEFPLFAEKETGPALAVAHPWDTQEITMKKQQLASRYVFWRRTGPFFLFRRQDSRAF